MLKLKKSGIIQKVKMHFLKKFILVIMFSANETTNIKQNSRCLLLNNVILHSVLNDPFTGKMS